MKANTPGPPTAAAPEQASRRQFLVNSIAASTLITAPLLHTVNATAQTETFMSTQTNTPIAPKASLWLNDTRLVISISMQFEAAQF